MALLNLACNRAVAAAAASHIRARRSASANLSGLTKSTIKRSNRCASPTASPQRPGTFPDRRHWRYISVRTESVRVHPRELCAEQEYLRGVIDPYEEHRQRAGGAEAGSDAAFAEIEANEELADQEQECGDRGPNPHVVPGDVYPRQNFVHQCEHCGNYDEADHEIERVQQPFEMAKNAAPPASQRHKHCAHDKRYQQHESH